MENFIFCTVLIIGTQRKIRQRVREGTVLKDSAKGEGSYLISILCYVLIFNL